MSLNLMIDDVFSDEGMMPIKSAGSTKVGRC